jgi:hypothetical protein
MIKHCRVCKEERKFNLVSEDELIDIYECETCMLKSKRRTKLGWGFASAGLIMTVGCAVLGIESLHDHNS